jgi:hypothetical protein
MDPAVPPSGRIRVCSHGKREERDMARAKTKPAKRPTTAMAVVKVCGVEN